MNTPAANGLFQKGIIESGVVDLDRIKKQMEDR